MASAAESVDFTTHESRVEYFLMHSVLRYGVHPTTGDWDAHRAYRNDGPESLTRRKAGALLNEFPEIAGENIHTAVAAGDLKLVEEFLAKDPKLAGDKHSLDGWQPLMRLAYARLPTSPTLLHTSHSAPVQDYASDAVLIAECLLKNGADASGGQLHGELATFHALTGVIGCGEAQQPEHPRARQLLPLLLKYGAEPLDAQALYNLSCNENADGDFDDPYWYDVLWEASRDNIAKMQGSDHDSEFETRSLWQKRPSDGTLPRGPLEYLLRRAVPHEPKRVKWLLDHGADSPNADA